MITNSNYTIPTITTTSRRNFSLLYLNEERLKPWKKWYVGDNEKIEITEKHTFNTGKKNTAAHPRRD